MLYEGLWNACQKILPEPDLTIFLGVEPNIAIQRLNERENLSVSPEVPFSFISEYVKDLDLSYKRFIANGLIRPTKTFNNNDGSLKDFAAQVYNLILSH